MLPKTWIAAITTYVHSNSCPALIYYITCYIIWKQAHLLIKSGSCLLFLIFLIKILTGFLIIPTRCNNFSNLFSEWKSTCFGQFLYPGLLTACELASCQQTCMTYTNAVCTVKNSWQWTEELSETCRVSFQEQIWEISASSWFYYKKFNIIYGHMNVKYRQK